MVSPTLPTPAQPDPKSRQEQAMDLLKTLAEALPPPNTPMAKDKQLLVVGATVLSLVTMKWGFSVSPELLMELITILSAGYAIASKLAQAWKAGHVADVAAAAAAVAAAPPPPVLIEEPRKTVVVGGRPIVAVGAESIALLEQHAAEFNARAGTGG